MQTQNPDGLMSQSLHRYAMVDQMSDYYVPTGSPNDLLLTRKQSKRDSSPSRIDNDFTTGLLISLRCCGGLASAHLKLDRDAEVEKAEGALQLIH